MNNLVKHFPRNEIGRDFVVGDIHGCFDTLSNVLHDVSFDESRDRLFSVGDLVDRGNQSEESIDWIAKPWFHAVRGNHEEMAIEWSHGEWPTDNYISNGGKWFTMLSIERRKLFTEIFESLPIMIEIDHRVGKVGIVHAEVPGNNWQMAIETLQNATQTNHQVNILHELNFFEKAIWSRTKINNQNTSKIEGVERVYVGHTPIKEWAILGNVYYIDTGEVFGNKLTLLEIK